MKPDDGSTFDTISARIRVSVRRASAALGPSRNLLRLPPHREATVALRAERKPMLAMLLDGYWRTAAQDGTSVFRHDRRSVSELEAQLAALGADAAQRDASRAYIGFVLALESINAVSAPQGTSLALALRRLIDFAADTVQSADLIEAHAFFALDQVERFARAYAVLGPRMEDAPTSLKRAG